MLDTKLHREPILPEGQAVLFAALLDRAGRTALGRQPEIILRLVNAVADIAVLLCDAVEDVVDAQTQRRVADRLRKARIGEPERIAIPRVIAADVGRVDPGAPALIVLIGKAGRTLTQRNAVDLAAVDEIRIADQDVGRNADIGGRLNVEGGVPRNVAGDADVGRDDEAAIARAGRVIGRRERQVLLGRMESRARVQSRQRLLDVVLRHRNAGKSDDRDVSAEQRLALPRLIEIGLDVRRPGEAVAVCEFEILRGLGLQLRIGGRSDRDERARAARRRRTIDARGRAVNGRRERNERRIGLAVRTAAGKPDYAAAVGTVHERDARIEVRRRRIERTLHPEAPEGLKVIVGRPRIFRVITGRSEVERRIGSEDVIRRAVGQRVRELAVGIRLVQPAIAETNVVLRHREIFADQVPAIVVEVEIVRARAVRTDRRARTLLLVVVIGVDESLKGQIAGAGLLRRARVVVLISQRAPTVDAAAERSVEVESVLRRGHARIAERPVYQYGDAVVARARLAVD